MAAAEQKDHLRRNVAIGTAVGLVAGAAVAIHESVAPGVGVAAVVGGGFDGFGGVVIFSGAREAAREVKRYWQNRRERRSKVISSVR